MNIHEIHMAAPDTHWNSDPEDLVTINVEEAE
jgi:hypothetical protein